MVPQACRVKIEIQIKFMLIIIRLLCANLCYMGTLISSHLPLCSPLRLKHAGCRGEDPRRSDGFRYEARGTYGHEF